jgi:hypothetical protein
MIHKVQLYILVQISLKMAVTTQFISFPLGCSESSSADPDPLENQIAENLSVYFLNEMRAFLYDLNTKNTFRMDPTQFTRNRQLIFSRTAGILLYQHNNTLDPFGWLFSGSRTERGSFASHGKCIVPGPNETQSALLQCLASSSCNGILPDL